MCGWIVEKQKFNDEVIWNLEEEEFQRESSGKSLKNNTCTNDQITMSHI